MAAVGNYFDIERHRPRPSKWALHRSKHSSSSWFAFVVVAGAGVDVLDHPKHDTVLFDHPSIGRFAFVALVFATQTFVVAELESSLASDPGSSFERRANRELGVAAGPVDRGFRVDGSRRRRHQETHPDLSAHTPSGSYCNK